MRSQTRANGPARRQHELGPRRTRRRRGVIARRGELRTGGGVCSRSATPSGHGGPRPTIRRQRRTLLQIEVHSRKQLRGSQTPPHLTTTPQCSNFLSSYLVSLFHPIPKKSCPILFYPVQFCPILFSFVCRLLFFQAVDDIGLLYTSYYLPLHFCMKIFALQLYYWLPCLGLPSVAWRGCSLHSSGGGGGICVVLYTH